MVKLRGLLLGIVFAAVAVGFAAAMPGAMSVSEVEDGSVQELVDEADKASAKPKPDKSKPAKEDVEEDEAAEDGGAKPDDNHGSVVSAVAKCDVKGRWHGEAVRSIAQNKEATLADAEAACAAAQAAAAAAGGPGNSAQAKSKPKGKPDSAGVKAPKAPKPTKPQAPPATSEASAEEPSSSGAGSSGSSGSGGPPAGKGGGKP